MYVYVCIAVRYKLSVRGACKEVRRVSGLEVKLKKLKFREFRDQSSENSEIEIQRIRRSKFREFRDRNSENSEIEV